MDIESKNITLIIENQFFGTTNWYKSLFQFSNIIIEQYESYQKMSFRNRCVVAGSNGPVHLSVPLEKGRDRQELVKEVRINYSGRWRKEHLRTLDSCYSRSPFYEYYRDDVRRLWEQEDVFLFDKNMSILDWLKKVLAPPANISVSESYRKEYPEGITDLRGRILPKNFQEQPAVCRYTQVFEERTGFLPNLSILDLLFCAGPETGSLLRREQMNR